MMDGQKNIKVTLLLHVNLKKNVEIKCQLDATEVFICSS